MENSSPPKKPGDLLESRLRLLGDGLKQIRYDTVLLQPGESIIINKTYILLLAALVCLKRLGKLPTVEFLPKNKWTTLKDKKTFSKTTTLATTWLQMLAPDLIGKEKALKPFWTKQTKEMSQKLWLPTETDFVDLRLNSLSTSSKSTMSNLLLSMKILNRNQPLTKNFQTISSPSSTSTPVEKWDAEDILKTKRIRIYPNKNQKKIIKEWMSTSRYVYNRCISEIRSSGFKALNGFQLRDKFVTSKNNPNVKDWEIKTPKGPRDGSVRDVKKAYKTAFSNLKQRNIRKFDVGFRTKKNGFQSIEIPKTAVELVGNKLKLFPRSGIGNIKISKRDHKIVGKPEYYCRLKVDQYGDWYLLVPVKSITKTCSKTKKCALDPGIRKFQTLYSNSEVIKCTTNYELLRTLKNRIAHYQSLRAKKVISKQTFKRKQMKDWKRHRNLIDDFQFKFGNYLATNYSEIYLPKFESQKLTKNLNKTSNFNLLNLQHYRFKERLRFQCFEQGSKLVDCTEEYTSKTCTQCGELNDTLGCSEQFRCPKCNLSIDRDVNGARNIYLKNVP